ncbi:MerR family transcriptional regulator [Nocardioides sp. MAHUQ-72]|uniref:MerR family transcriptional regulator n=1 Tax=unclassified Nocardioides TaxID=2615069 RepID=UPI00360D3EFA
MRHYDEIGLLRPSGRTDGGFRLYAEADVERLFVIRRMKPLGFSLEEMAEVMDVLETLHPADGSPRDGGGPAYDAAAARLLEVLDQARERRERLRRQLDMADEFIGLLTEQLEPGSAPDGA